MEILCFVKYLMKILTISIIFHIFEVNAASSVTYLEPGTQTEILPEAGRFGYNIEKLNIFCFRGGERNLHNFLQSIVLSVDIDSDDFTCFSGFSPKEVEQAHEAHRSLFSFNWFSSSKKRVMNLNPFNKTCIGLETAEQYKISLSLIQADSFKLSLLFIGLGLFFTSTSLSHNSLFFYLTGIGLGNVASIVVLIWFLSKLFPKKPLMYGVLASGWTLAAYLGRILIENIQPILMTYQKYVLIYILITSCISFAVCYYKGPPKKERSKNLIKWSLQIIGLVAIFFSSEMKEASIALGVSCILLYFFPTGNIFKGLRNFWRRRFPKKRRLLTTEEFEEQGRIETEKALKELREYLKSPKCKSQWSLVKNLSQPVRFASFVEGDDHVTLDETVEYDSMMHTMDFSDCEEISDDSDATIEESIAVNENFHRIEKSKIPTTVNGKVNGNTSRRVGSFGIGHVSSSTPKLDNSRNGSVRTTRRGNTSKSYKEYDISDDD